MRIHFKEIVDVLSFYSRKQFLRIRIVWIVFTWDVYKRQEYEQAADLLPKEEYPQNQINRINSIIAEEARLAAEAEAAEQARLAALQAEKDSQYALSLIHI